MYWKIWFLHFLFSVFQTFENWHQLTSSRKLSRWLICSFIDERLWLTWSFRVCRAVLKLSSFLALWNVEIQAYFSGFQDLFLFTHFIVYFFFNISAKRLVNLNLRRFSDQNAKTFFVSLYSYWKNCFVNCHMVYFANAPRKIIAIYLDLFVHLRSFNFNLA